MNVFVVEDHSVMREMLREFLAMEADIEVTGVAESAEAALEQFADAVPDLVLIDMSLPGMSGIELVRRLRLEHPGLYCAMLSGHGEGRYLRQAFDAGANGYILKGEPDEVPRAIQQILQGERYVSEELQR